MKTTKTLSLILIVLLLFAGVSSAEVEREEHGSLDSEDVIELPITIYDFHNDGMLFEFASYESVWSQTKEYGGKIYNLGNNYAFGLIGASMFNLQNPNCYDLPSIDQWDGEGGITTQGIITSGLVEPTLGEGGAPVYVQSSVEYLAALLRATLAIEERDAAGNYNYNYVQGSADAELFGTNADGSARDLAAAFRQHIGDNLEIGSYEQTLSSPPTTLSDVKTCTDAAWFLLNNLFTDTYSREVSCYNTLTLSRQTDEAGNRFYVFDSSYDGVSYDSDGGKIFIDAVQAVSERFRAWGSTYIPAHYFLPITPQVYDYYCGETLSPYVFDVGVTDFSNGQHYDSSGAVIDTYDSRDYNFTLRSNSTFVYNEADDLYFRFTGDDDVYLFINGVLALDLGGAHSIVSGEVRLNDIKEACNLIDGEEARLDFYYMERHGYGSNLRIETNMELKEPEPNVFTGESGAQAHIEFEDESGVGKYTNGIRFKMDLDVEKLKQVMEVGDYFACGALLMPLNKLNANSDDAFDVELMSLLLNAQNGSYGSANAAPVTVMEGVAAVKSMTRDTMVMWTEQMEQAASAGELIPLLREGGMTVFSADETDTAIRYAIYLTFTDNGTLTDEARQAQADREIAFRGFFVRYSETEGYSGCLTHQKANSATRIFNHYNYENFGVLNEGVTEQTALNGYSKYAPVKELQPQLIWEVYE
ncbi:MAG: fibro-slime domain-containing protein [Clostridia bacterium]|nr:fibro-slime domain-containing protein [Clostridia bacterium]